MPENAGSTQEARLGDSALEPTVGKAKAVSLVTPESWGWREEAVGRGITAVGWGVVEPL
jgi:hypothetical protein